ncbi:unnamed protein product, partial [Closterium sp. NIES-64]
YSCIAPAWTVAIESDSQDELKPVGGVAAMIDVIGPLSDLRGSMGDSETDLGVMEEADAPRKMEEAEPAPRWMEEAELSRRKEEAEPPRGMVDAERSADRLQYPGRKRVVGLVGVFTDFSSRERRSLLRDTWFPATPEEHARLEAEAGLVFRFIIGHGTSAEEEEQLQVENSTHGDLLRIDVDEADFNANRKALVYFTSLFKLYEAEFYVKADDDIYLIPDRLASLVAMPRKSPRTYLGCFKNGAVVTNPDMSEFEPNSRLLGPQYFLHAYSNIYSLSYGVVKILNSVPNG